MAIQAVPQAGPFLNMTDEFWLLVLIGDYKNGTFRKGSNNSSASRKVLQVLLDLANPLHASPFTLPLGKHCLGNEKASQSAEPPVAKEPMAYSFTTFGELRGHVAYKIVDAQTSGDRGLVSIGEVRHGP